MPCLWLEYNDEDQPTNAFVTPTRHRKEAYNADITYGTNNEFGFDYLRDNMTSEVQYLRQRELNFAIVDEVDSILIDEARTSLFPLPLATTLIPTTNLPKLLIASARRLCPRRKTSLVTLSDKV